MSDSDNESDVMDEWAEALEESGDASSDDSSSDVVAATDAGVAAAGFDNLEDNSSSSNDDINMDVILDIPVKLSMEIGRTSVNIRSLLQLNQGSVIELDRMAGEPLDVLVNGTLIAHGEVVVVNEKFGIRLTDVVSPAERVKKLR
ncbi:Flagellar motor switch protein FliN [hydrothermal vent metagenome]|uniref:Flagellar motor switch protein FliN n=1 Tax=hydrothermal vent metagenome TaxID=652676 RepID=A0A3B1AHS3_9ZZZZ